MHTLFGTEVRALVATNVCGLKKLGTDIGYIGRKGAKTHTESVLKHGQTSVLSKTSCSCPSFMKLPVLVYDLPAETRSDLPWRDASAALAVHVPPVRRVDARIHAGVFLSVGLV